MSAPPVDTMEEVPVRFQCPVCQEVLKKPTAITECGHM